jgi:glycosyltransferase involved in cell wall biosynthesis
MAVWVWSYYPLQRWALPRIADVLADEIEPHAAGTDLIHNCRIGREGISSASYQVAHDNKLPFVLTPVHHPRWDGWLHRYYHELYRRADAVIALTEAERQMLVRLGVQEARIFVTGNGPVLTGSADPEGFRNRYSLGAGPLVLFLGQKYAYKGLAALLTAAHQVWRSFPTTRFAFVGPRTPYSRRLFARIRDRRILELDKVDVQEKTDALAACDILCLPSTQESFGGVFTEAWSLGKPVVGCDIPAVRSVIDDGQDGLLTQQDPDEIAKRLVYLLGEPEARERMGQCGKAKVNARYTWPRLAQATERVYRQVLQGR